jgi:DnaJ-class molecular chaperone
MKSTCRKCGGQGYTITTPCRKCRGKGKVSETVNITVPVPAGKETNLMLKLIKYCEMLDMKQIK